MSLLKKLEETCAKLDAHHEDPWRKKVEAEVRGKEFISTAALLDAVRAPVAEGQGGQPTRAISSDGGMPEMPEIAHTLSIVNISHILSPPISLVEQDDISCISCIDLGVPARVAS